MNKQSVSVKSILYVLQQNLDMKILQCVRGEMIVMFDV